MRFTMSVLTRRTAIKYIALTTLGLSLPLRVQAQGKTLVLYFSRSGNTKAIAEFIQKKLACDIAELKPAKPYPDTYDDVVQIAKKEQGMNARPAFAKPNINLADYTTIFLGYPNWWGTMPMFFFTFLESVDTKGKIIVPFCTHGGSALGNSVDDIKKLCPTARVLKGLAIKGNKAKNAQAEVATFLSQLGLSAK